MEVPEWSDWVPFDEALHSAPRQPGVYMAREGTTGAVVYIGMAGKRTGGGRPQGIRGRLAVYATGKGLASGLGEAVFDRALADAEWLQARLDELRETGPRRAKHWGIAAFSRAHLEIRWTVTADRASAAALEDQLVREAGSSLWNKASARLLSTPTRAIQVQSVVRRSLDLARTSPLTQRVTAGDLAAGKIRVPSASKRFFPAESSSVVVETRGEVVTCGWNPMMGPDKERSGVLRLPREVLRRLVRSDERLEISTAADRIRLT